MPTDDQVMMGDSRRVTEKTNYPQLFLLKIRRGCKFTYVTETGESESSGEAKDFGCHREVHVAAQMRLRESGVDGCEVEMVTI